jgi:uncharacterized Rmd1/YagE family protein
MPVRFASTTTPATSSKGDAKAQPVAPKPKSNTSLRKTASASLSIREKSTATRGAIKPVFTLSTAERYLLPPLLNVMKSSNAIMFAEALWLPQVRGQKHSAGDTEDVGEAFVFENGCAVFWGIQEDDARRFLDSLVRRNGVEIGRYIEEETEEVEFVIDPSEWAPLLRLVGIEN